MVCNIRKPVVEDIEEISYLFESTIRDNFKEEGIVDPEGVSAKEEIDALNEGVQDYIGLNKMVNLFLIATLQNKIIGTIAYGPASKLIYENLRIDYSNTPEIKSVYIWPSHQNRRVGTLLLRRILLELHENNIKDFCLDSGYKRAQYYWKKKFGKPICILNDYWGKNSHHMIWHCRVEEILEWKANVK